MWVKYKTITNNSLFGDSLPLDDEMELKGQGFLVIKKSEEMNNSIIPKGNCVRFYEFIFCKTLSHLDYTLH